MGAIKRLPDAEFEVMQLIWASKPPVTTAMLMKQLGNEKGWKIQTLVSLMGRLSERGFLRSEKKGKERLYYPVITQGEYLRFETGSFLERYHNHSLLNLVASFYGDASLSEEDLDALLTLTYELKERKQQGRQPCKNLS